MRRTLSTGQCAASKAIVDALEEVVKDQDAKLSGMVEDLAMAQDQRRKQNRDMMTDRIECMEMRLQSDMLRLQRKLEESVEVKVASTKSEFESMTDEIACAHNEYLKEMTRLSEDLDSRQREHEAHFRSVVESLCGQLEKVVGASEARGQIMPDEQERMVRALGEKVDKLLAEAQEKPDRVVFLPDNADKVTSAVMTRVNEELQKMASQADQKLMQEVARMEQKQEFRCDSAVVSRALQDENAVLREKLSHNQPKMVYAASATLPMTSQQESRCDGALLGRALQEESTVLREKLSHSPQKMVFGASATMPMTTQVLPQVKSLSHHSALSPQPAYATPVMPSRYGIQPDLPPGAFQVGGHF